MSTAHKVVAPGLDRALADGDGHQILKALRALFDCDRDAWWMNAGHFTCEEADAIEALFRACGASEDADVFAEAHSESDEHGDAHFQGS